ncbi:MAG TPA: ferredoxin reductase [Solirubrobacteraceae bacterium]
MAGAALPGRLSWQVTRVLELVEETPQATTIVLEAPDWPGYRAGQHIDVRLTAEDGYQAQRSYSIASAPEDPHLALTVERIADGEVSPYLLDELRAGDELELRGPIGGYFAWDGSLGGPLMLLAGGSGVVPLRSMLRHHAAAADSVPVRLLYSSRAWEEVIYRDELRRLGDGGSDSPTVEFTLTRAWPADWDGHRGRIDRALLAEVCWAPADRPLIYICGPNGFVETAAATMVQLGHEPQRIRTERFGPSGT